ncbi:MAG: NADH-quinone oxidoreductase subunit J [bacterium]|nr:NADH-quinone oxidoreductase subunit J [bacterium]
MSDPGSVGIAFWILSAIVLISGLLVVSLKNIFHCALFLMLCLTGVAGIFILLHAEFLAAAQVLVYVGAVSVLMIFAVMLTSNLARKKIVQTNQNALVAFVSCVAFVVGALWLIKGTEVWKFATEALPANNTMTIGKLLMTEFMLPFEVVSVLLVAAMIGAIVLARGEEA